MSLWTLYRRRKLAYELLAEYDRDSTPHPSYADSTGAVTAYAAFVERDPEAAARWREATLKVMDRYRDA